MNLGEFHARISGVIKRGNSLDDMIPLWVADAANLLELNYTFSWMKRTGSQLVVAGASGFALPPRTKSVFYIRPVLYDDGLGHQDFGDKLLGVEPDRITGISYARPMGFWIEGVDSIQFDSTAAEDMSYRFGYSQFTDWPVDDAATPSLLQRAQAVLTAQTLILFSMEAKDARMQALYESRLEVAIGMLLRAEEELKMQHQSDLQMQYTGFGPG